MRVTPGPNVVIDLSDVPFMDSSGVGVVARAAARSADPDGSLTVRNPQAGPTQVMRVTGMDTVVTIERTDL